MQDTGLNGGANGDDFIRIDALVRIAAKEGFHRLDHLGHTAHTADKDYLVDFAFLQPGILQSLFTRRERALDQIFDKMFELRAGQLQLHMLGAACIRRNERQVDFRRLGRRQFDLGLFRSFLQALQCHLVAAQVNALLLLEFIRQIIDEFQIEVFTAEESIAVGGADLEDAIADFKDGNVERTAAKVIYGNGLVRLVHAVCKRGRRRLVNNAQDFKPGDLAGVLGCLALCVVKVGRNCDNGLCDGLAEIAFGGFLHFLKDESGNLARGVFLAAGLDPGVTIIRLDDIIRNHFPIFLGGLVIKPPPDKALDRKKCVLRIGDTLTLGRLADESLPVFREGDHGRGGSRPFRIFNDLCIFAVHNGDAGVGRSQVNSDYFSHHILFNIGRSAWPLHAPR